jgi:hypothetical protein
MRHLIPLEKIEELANANNYFRLDYQDNIGMVSYSNGAVRTNIYLSKMTVSTGLNHPKQGKTQMFRKNVTLVELAKIFENPRVHTNKGYKKKKDAK